MDGVGDGDRQHERTADGGEQLHDRIGEPAGEHQAHVGAAVVLVDRLELPVEVPFGVVHLDEPRRLEALLGDAGDIAHGVLDAAAVAPELVVDDRHQPADQRTHDERDQRQAGIHPQQKADRADDGQRGADHRDHRVSGGLADLLAVVGEPRQQRAGGAAVEVADRQAQDVAEHVAAQLTDDAAADVAHEVGLGEIAEAAQQEYADQRHRQPDDGARVLVLERAVAELLGEQREAGVAGSEEHPAEEAEDEAAAVRSQVAEQPSVGSQRALAPDQRAAGSGRASGAVVQGLPAGSSLTVAMLTSAKPRRPSTSMAVITDWWVARASARKVTRMLRLLPASLRMAARSVSGLELISSWRFTT